MCAVFSPPAKPVKIVTGRRPARNSYSALVAEHARPQPRAKRPRNGNSSPSSRKQPKHCHTVHSGSLSHSSASTTRTPLIAGMVASFSRSGEPSKRSVQTGKRLRAGIANFNTTASS